LPKSNVCHRMGAMNGKQISTVSLDLKDGWRASVVLEDSGGDKLSQAAWRQFLAEPEQLLKLDGERLKADGQNSVVAQPILLGERRITAVIKVRMRQDGFREFFRWLRPARAMRNFKTALKLRAMGITAEYPLAALEQRKGFGAKYSIYVSEYMADSPNLYHFVRDELNGIGPDEAAVRRAAAYQVAEILAGLHNNGLWHRDAKAPNFLVGRKNGSCRVTLVDLDGIKPYRLARRRSRLRSLIKLTATVMPLGNVNRSDYWRAFLSYCKLTSMNEDRRRLFHELAMSAAAARLLSVATSAIEGRCEFTDGK